MSCAPTAIDRTPIAQVARWHHSSKPRRSTSLRARNRRLRGPGDPPNLQGEGRRPMTRQRISGRAPGCAAGDVVDQVMIAPARLAAFDASIAVSAGRLDLSDAVAAARRSLRDDRDKALAAEIAIGVQRWRAALDHLIVHFSKRRLDRLDPEIVEILRLSAYQLLHLTRVPASAVVDDAVNLAGRAGKRSAAGPRQRGAPRSVTKPAVASSAASSGRDPIEIRPSTIWRSPCRIRAGSSNAGSIATGSTRPSSGCASTTPPRR